MKKKINLLWLFMVALLVTGCFEDYNQRYLFDDLRVEFQDAVIRNNSPGLSYPIVGTVRSNSSHSYQINLFGGLSESDQIIAVRIVDDHTTAQEGIHYNLPLGLDVVVPAGEAFGYLELEIPELEEDETVRVVFELQSNEMVQASANHKSIGVNIAP